MTENTALINKSVTKDDYTTVSSDGGVVSLFVPFFSWTQQDNLTLPPEAPPYWTQQRDIVLRATIHNEAMWAGAVGIAIAQMASLAWEVQSEIPLRAKRAQDILLQADGHRVGWVGFLSKQLRDFLCLAGPTMVQLGGDRIGRVKSIRDIVQDRDPGPVLSVDTNGNIVEREVIQWHKTPLGDRKWWWLSLRNSTHGEKGPGGIYGTNDHPVLTESGWLPMERVAPGMRVATGDFEPSEEQSQFLVGTLLGDASISSIKDRACLRFYQCVEQEDWLKHKQALLKGFRWTGYQTVSNTRGLGNGNLAVAVNSRGSVPLMRWRNDWYPNGKKIVPRDYVERYFSPRMLAAWYCDDGTMHRHFTRAGNETTPTASLYTNGFTVEDATWLSELLVKNGVDCKVLYYDFSKNGKKHPVISISAEGFRSFVKMIGSHVPPVMRYKLPNNAPDYDPGTSNIEPARPYYDEVVISEQRDYRTGYRVCGTTYNIAVRETENFIAANMVVHNCTDNGQFAEIVRATSSVGSKIIGLKHMDSLRCTRTGDPERPVVYRDRRGRMHVLRDYQVLMLSDMPDPSDTYFGVGTCAASRAYAAIYKLNRIEWYLREKVGGLHPLAIHIVNGILTKQIEDAVGAAQQQQISKGAASYMGAVIMGTPKETPPDLVTIPLAELPDRFNRKEEFDIAVLTYANALGLDIQDLQPLTGQALGTGAQSQVLDDKSRGKGLSSWRQSWTHALNEYVLDEMTTFMFVEKDYRDQERQTAVQKAHAEVAGMRIDKGITTPAQELQLLVDYDDLPKAFLPKDETPGDSLSDTDKPEAEEAQQEGAAAADPSDETAKPGEKPEAERPAGEEKGEWGKKEAQGDVDKSVMVALFIPSDVAEQIAVDGGNPASDLHITLAYLGDEATDALDRDKVEAVIEHLTESHPAVTGVINGRGLFEVGEGTRAHFLTYDAPTLPGLRQAIIDALKANGFTPVENHGFVPHITLTYNKNERGPKVELPKGEMKVPALTLAWGNERSHFPFQGERLKASDESIEEASKLLVRVMDKARKRAKKEAVYA